MDNIIEICVAIDIAILGIAYPILIDKISGIGEKYQSNYLSNVFNAEFPQRAFKFKWRKRPREISVFKLILYATICSFLLLIINAKPWFSWDNPIINNSAKIIVFILSASLTICFFKWLDLVILFNGKATSVLHYLTSRYQAKPSAQEDYHLKTINEFAVYAIDRQDEHLQETLLEFYYLVFSKIRQDHDRSKPIVYPFDLYEMVYRLCYKLNSIENKYLLALEHRAVSGIWLLGEDFEEIEISEETYSWLWRILNTIHEREKFVRMYWSRAHQYYEMQMPYIMSEYDEAFQITNEEEVEKRKREKERFLEFHFALGGLLLYRKQYSTIDYIFHYTQSQPPRYVLLPESMTPIFKWFELFSNEFKHRGEPLDYKYYFPELDNLGNRRAVNYWMCSYMALLFVRLYSMNEYFTYQNFTAQPNLPDKIYELRDWLDAVPHFERCLKNLLENEDLIEALGYETIVAEKRESFFKYLDELKASIVAKLGEQKLNAPLSVEKLNQFKASSREIITNAFTEYNQIANTGAYVEEDNDLKLTIIGQTNLTNKSSFLDDTGVAHLNYDTILASTIASQSIRKYIPNSFVTARTRRYLLNPENIVQGIQKLIGNRKDVVIVAINLTWNTREILQKFQPQLKEIRGSEHRLQDMLFVLKRSDLPYLVHKELGANVVEEKRFERIDEDLNIYTAVLDLSQAENASVREKWSKEDLEDEAKIQITIALLTLIIYKNSRDIVQLNIASRYKEQGIQNSLEDIDSFK
ncbi:hypothetical protein [Flavobacterium sp.]|uniref:hypothetical protein n=1 Tax=Flavobacterium sp. TaxID=239 RepID=UPI0039E318A3